MSDRALCVGSTSLGNHLSPTPGGLVWEAQTGAGVWEGKTRKNGREMNRPQNTNYIDLKIQLFKVLYLDLIMLSVSLLWLQRTPQAVIESAQAS